MWLIAHRAELVKQIAMTLARFGVKHRIIAPGPIIRQVQVEQFRAFGRSFVDATARVLVCSVQTVVKRLDAGLPPPHLVVVDECFPAGTLIDGVPIESRKIGDMVRSSNHLNGKIEQKRITRLFKSRPKSLCTVYLENGESIVCTTGHPIFVHGYGYHHAENLQPGMPIFKLQRMWCGGSDRQQLQTIEDAQTWMGFLREGLLYQVSGENFLGNHGADKSQVRIRPDDCSQPDEKIRGARKDEGDSQGNWAQAANSWREWKGNDGSSILDAGRSFIVFQGRGGGVCAANKDGARHGVSDALQDRLGDPVRDDCGRNRRHESRISISSGAGREERCIPQIIRVDRVEIHEQDGDGGFGRLLPDGFVYNIEVEDNHNYFANDFLVHNCHHLTADSSWGRVVSAYPDAKILPVTATPCRLDGKGLGVDHGGFADALIMGPTMRELIEAGYLSPYRIFAPPNSLDLTGVRTRMGDYAKDQLSAAVDKPKITGDAVEHYRRLADGKRAVAFCVSVAHAENVAQEFAAAGVPAEVLDGSLDAMERDRRIKRFESGETLVLASCDVVSEGFDLPAIEVAILLRPTQSLALYLQQVGRALRIFPGKEYAIILDHVGAIATHGLPDEEREWSLEGVKPRAKKASQDEGGEESIQTCPKCYTVHRPAPACPTCAYVYPIKARKIEEQSGELVEITTEDLDRIRRQKRALQGSAQTVDELMAKTGMKRTQAEKIIQARADKAALIAAVLDDIEAVRRATGCGPWQAFGVTLGDVRSMKPKALKELKARTAESVKKITESA